MGTPVLKLTLGNVSEVNLHGYHPGKLMNKSAISYYSKIPIALSHFPHFFQKMHLFRKEKNCLMFSKNNSTLESYCLRDKTFCIAMFFVECMFFHCLLNQAH